MSPDFGRIAGAPELWRAQLRSRCRQPSGELPVLLNSGEPSYVAGVARFGELPVLLNSGEPSYVAGVATFLLADAEAAEDEVEDVVGVDGADDLSECV